MPIERAAPGAALLPGGGHVLDSNEVCRRLRLASDTSSAGGRIDKDSRAVAVQPVGPRGPVVAMIAARVMSAATGSAAGTPAGSAAGLDSIWEAFSGFVSSAGV